jgi:hypothetical protein
MSGEPRHVIEAAINHRARVVVSVAADAAIQRASTAAKYSSVPAAQRCPVRFARIQRALTALSDSHAVTLQAGVSNRFGTRGFATLHQACCS